MNYIEQYNRLPEMFKKLVFVTSFNNPNPQTQLTTHFQRFEVQCGCGCGRLPSPLSLSVLELLRQKTGKPFVIHSGARCPNYNKKIGGARYSDHIAGEAFDIKIDSRLTYEIIRQIILLEKKFDGALVQKISPYTKHLHISILERHTTPAIFPGHYEKLAVGSLQ